MSDKLREEFEKHESLLRDLEYMPGFYAVDEVGLYENFEMQERWEGYKAATERAARICDKSQCCECGSGELLAKEIRGE